MFEPSGFPEKPMMIIPSRFKEIGELSLTSPTNIINAIESLFSSLNKLSFPLFFPINENIKSASITIVPIRDVDYEIAEKEIKSYIKSMNGKEIYISELAEELRLDLDLIIQVVNKLKNGGEVNFEI